MKRGRIILVIILVGIVSVPVLGFGYVAVGCSLKMRGLNAQTADIKHKIEQTNLAPAQNLDVYTNGDCLTGSGTGFQFTLDNPSGTPISIIKIVTAGLSSAGVPAPRDVSTPEYLSGQDGNASGGDTPIRQIKATYSTGDDYDTYSFTFELPEVITCTYGGLNSAVTCDGKEKDELLRHLLDTAEVSSVDVHGSVWKD